MPDVDIFSISSFVLLQRLYIKTYLTRSYDFEVSPRDGGQVRIHVQSLESSSIDPNKVDQNNEKMLQMKYLYIGKKARNA